MTNYTDISVYSARKLVTIIEISNSNSNSNLKEKSTMTNYLI